FLVAKVVDARLQGQVVRRFEGYASVDEAVCRIAETVGAGTAGAGLPAAGGLAAVVVLGPDVDPVGGLPVKRGVEHVLGIIVVWLALEVARLLLGLGVGVGVAIGHVVEQAVVQGSIDASHVLLVISDAR